MIKENKNSLAISIAILVTGFIVAGAIFVSKSSDNDSKQVDNSKDSKMARTEQIDVEEYRHLLGSPDANIKIVEYSDTECPYCKNFHVTMHQVIDEYGTDGQVAWVYKHFPIDQLHPKARKEAEATECAAELGGNQKFWEYIDRLFEVTPSNNGLDMSQLPEIAENVGLDRVQFNKCLSGGKYAEIVEKDYQDAVAVGVRGTPHSIIMVNGVVVDTIGGAQPYSVVKQKIEAILIK